MSFLRNPVNIAGVSLIIAFFLPWAQVFVSWSGYALATGQTGSLLTPLAPLVPLGGILVIAVARAGRKVRTLTRVLTGLIPFLLLVVACLEEGSVLDVLGSLRVGAYLAFGSGGVLVVYGLKREHED